jgi:hypothetical protein
MTRQAAYRTGLLLVLLALVFCALSFGSRVEAASAMTLISVTLSALMLAFAATVSVRTSAVPVRARARNRRF